MKFNDMVSENKLDELSPGEVVTGLGKGVKSVGSGIANFAKGFGQGLMGKQAGVSTKDPLKDIKAAISKLNAEQLADLRKHIDTLAKSAATATPQTSQNTQTNPQTTAGQPTAKPAARTNPQTAASQPAVPGQPTAKPAASTAPAQSRTAPAAPGAKTAPATGKNAAANDTYEKSKANIRSVQGGEKPLPANIAQGIQADLAKMAKGDKESGVFAADKIMKLAKLGMDVKDIQAKWLANSKAGERFLTQSQYFEISKMLREHGLRWSDLGLRIHLVEGTNAYFGISKI